MSEDHNHQHLLCVPVRDTACGFALRLFRNRDGSRCAAAFTSEERLATVLGTGQRWVPLAEPALRDLARPLGVLSLVVDPSLVAPPVPQSPARQWCELPPREWQRRFAEAAALHPQP